MLLSTRMNTSYKSSNRVVVLVEEGCSVDVRNYVDYDVDIVTIPSRRIMAGNQPLWELRALKDVAIPNGIEKIGDRWFAGSSVESVRVPASVREIGKEAFYLCRDLK